MEKRSKEREEQRVRKHGEGIEKTWERKDKVKLVMMTRRKGMG